MAETSPAIAVDGSVASGAESDQIFEAVMTKLTSGPDVMKLQVFNRAAILTTPSIPRENLLTKILVCLWHEPYPRLLGPQS